MTSCAAEGRWGEDYTAKHLLTEGYRILERNWHCRFGEIDLIAQKDGVLAFVEVKTRKAGSLTNPEEAVSPAKRKKIIASAQCYLLEHWDATLQPRFDVAAVTVSVGEPFLLREFRYYESAFEEAES